MRFIPIVLLVTLSACSNDKKAKEVDPVQQKLKNVYMCPPGAINGFCESFLIDVSGKNGGAPNANDVKAVQDAIGSLTTSLQIENYYLIEKHATGGFLVCFDPVANTGFGAAEYALSTFRLDDRVTNWDPKLVHKCTTDQ